MEISVFTNDSYDVATTCYIIDDTIAFIQVADIQIYGDGAKHVIHFKDGSKLATPDVVLAVGTNWITEQVFGPDLETLYTTQINKNSVEYIFEYQTDDADYANTTIASFGAIECLVSKSYVLLKADL